MKTLRYLLIVAMISMASVLSAANAVAQNLAERPEVQMYSTSGMVSSGSQLPSAAIEGTYVTGTTIGTYTPADANSSGNPKRIKRGLGGTGGSGGPEDRPEPYEDPIGDAMIPLAVLACAYLIWRVMRKRKRA